MDTQMFRTDKRQTLKDFEVILVDNNSTDKTVEKAHLAGVKKNFFN